MADDVLKAQGGPSLLEKHLPGSIITPGSLRFGLSPPKRFSPRLFSAFLPTGVQQRKEQDLDNQKKAKDFGRTVPRLSPDQGSDVYLLRKMVEEVFDVLYSKEFFSSSLLWFDKVAFCERSAVLLGHFHSPSPPFGSTSSQTVAF